MGVIVFILFLIGGLLFIRWADNKKQKDAAKRTLKAAKPPRNWRESTFRK